MTRAFVPESSRRVISLGEAHDSCLAAVGGGDSRTIAGTLGDDGLIEFAFNNGNKPVDILSQLVCYEIPAPRVNIGNGVLERVRSYTSHPNIEPGRKVLGHTDNFGMVSDRGLEPIEESSNEFD